MRHEQDDSMAAEHAVRMLRKKVEMHREALEQGINGESLDEWVARNERNIRNRLTSLSALTYAIERMAQEREVR
jgi:predicted transcriptional regulator